MWSVAVNNLYFESINRQHFVKCFRLWNNAIFENYGCRQNNATFGKSAIVSETMQHLENAHVDETI